MAFTLKVLDSNASQQQLQNVLIQARRSIIKRAYKKQGAGNIKDLQATLNDIFYQSDNKFNYAQQLEENMSRISEKTLAEVVENFDFRSNYGEHYDSEHQIRTTTLVNALRTIENIINELPGENNSKKLLQKKNQLQQMLIKGRSYVSTIEAQYTDNQSYGYILQKSDPRMFKEVRKIINQANALISLQQNKTLTPSLLGFEFEKALAKIRLMEVAENMAYDLVEEEFADQHTGTTPTQRGTYGGALSYTISSSQMNHQKLEDQGFVIENGNATFTYNPFQNKQAKMDVKLYFNANTKKDAFRISAKRWTGHLGRFGETSIEAAINRSSDNRNHSIAEAYRLAVLVPNEIKDKMGNSLQATLTANKQAHEFATMALKADIIMGLSQREGYADVLVIDTGSEIIVKDIVDIILKNQAVILEGYNPIQIEKLASDTYRSIGGVINGRTKAYLANMASSLSKMKVAINIPVNQLKK